MRVLLTGSTGFIGSHLLEVLVSNNIPIAILLRKEASLWRINSFIKNLNIITIDSENRFLDDIIEFNPDTLFNLAWYGVENKYNNSQDQININLDWIRFIFDIAKKTNIETIVSIGSQAEYGVKGSSLDEESLIAPTNLYGAAKVASYHLLRVLCGQSNIRLIWLRLFSSYGPRDNTTWFIPYLICELLQHKSPKLTKGEQYWDYAYVTDIANAMLSLAENANTVGVFNVGFGQSYQICHIAELIRNQIDSSMKLEFGARPYSSNQIMHMQANISKLYQQTGWQPKVSLEDGIAQTVEWFRKN